MKTKLIIIGVIIGVILLGVFLSPRSATFSISEDIESIYLTNKAGDIRYDNIKDGDSLWITPGEYQIRTKDKKFDSTNKTISISRALQSNKFSVDMPYTTDYLGGLVDRTTLSALTLLQDKYGSLMDSYTIVDAQLFDNANWYGAILYNKNSTINNKKDYFRFIMKYDGKEWSLVNRPVLIIDNSFSEVPQPIRSAINSSIPSTTTN